MIHKSIALAKIMPDFIKEKIDLVCHWFNFGFNIKVLGYIKKH